MNKKVAKDTLEILRDSLDNLLKSRNENAVVLYKDEAIITSELTSTAVWSKVGTQTIVKTDRGTRQKSCIWRCKS